MHPIRFLNSRLKPARLALLMLALSAFFVATTSMMPTAQAQVRRMFPGQALRGNMTFVSATQVVLDGRTERLGAGVRVRNQQNRTVFPSSLSGRNFAVNYLRDATGRISEVWLLTPAERTQDLRRSAPNRLQGSDVQPYLN